MQKQLSLDQLPKKIIDTLRYEGFFNFLWKVMKKIISPIGKIGITCFCRKDLTKPLEPFKPKIEVDIGEVRESEIAQTAFLEDFSTRPANPDTAAGNAETIASIHTRLAQGAKCLVARVGKEVVHYNWIFFNQVAPYHGYSFALNDSEAYFAMGFTTPEWRGKGIHSAVNNQMQLLMQKSGIKTAYTRVRYDNVISRRGLVRVGWEIYGILVYFTLHHSNKYLTWEIKGPLHPFYKGKNAP